jgi:glycosyltransferase involved in cell wall biosynthesis
MSPGVPPALSVIVPAFNEQLLLGSSIQALHASLAGFEIASEVIIVNDGSRDHTGAVADELAQRFGKVRVCHQPNQGIGGAFRTGAVLAAGEYIILWPVDMEAQPADLEPYISNLGVADVIVGCRRRRLGYNPVMLLNSWIYPKLVAVLFGFRIRDVNWIHAYRKSLFREVQLTQRGIPMLAEALVRLRDKGATFLEVDVVMRPRLGGIASASRLRVMWRTLTGLFSFWLAWRQEKRSPAPPAP